MRNTLLGLATVKIEELVRLCVKVRRRDESTSRQLCGKAVTEEHCPGFFLLRVSLRNPMVFERIQLVQTEAIVQGTHVRKSVDTTIAAVWLLCRRHKFVAASRLGHIPVLQQFLKSQCDFARIILTALTNAVENLNAFRIHVHMNSDKVIAIDMGGENHNACVWQPLVP